MWPLTYKVQRDHLIYKLGVRCFPLQEEVHVYKFHKEIFRYGSWSVDYPRQKLLPNAPFGKVKKRVWNLSDPVKWEKQKHISGWRAHQAHLSVDLCPCCHVSVYKRLLSEGFNNTLSLQLALWPTVSCEHIRNWPKCCTHKPLQSRAGWKRQ